MTKKNLAIFDLDGTLLDTIGDLAAACDYMIALRQLGDHTLEEYRKMVGNGITNLVSRALPAELRSTEYVERARRDFLEYYCDHIDIYTRPYDGIHEVVRILQERGWSLAVASNKFDEGTKRLVAKFFPDINFQAVHGNREGFPLKPDKALLDIIISECNSSPELCYMIGDSGVDIECAKSVGAHSIGCSWGFRPRAELEEHGAEVIADNTSELLQILK